MIIDFSSHIMTYEVAAKLSSKENFKRLQKNFASESSDPERRIELMEKYGIDMQVLTQTTPVLSGLNTDEASEICKISNDVIGKICLSQSQPVHSFCRCFAFRCERCCE